MVTPPWNEFGLGLPGSHMYTVRPATPMGAADDGAGWEDGAIVRPFVITGGRTRPVAESLRVETLVTTTPAALSAPLAFEHAHIVQLCRQPQSVAELAVGLELPIGVATVLIADLVSDRLLVMHAQIDLGDRPSRELLERVLHGVRAL
jgi:hypothetical protein